MSRTVDCFFRDCGLSTPCIVIAEVAQGHDGSLGFAHSFIDAVADTGADVIKFQTHIASAESTPLEPWRIKFSYQDDTRYDYWKRMEFTQEQWLGLKKHAEERGLLFMSSPFSSEAVDLLCQIGVPAWKLASGEISNIPIMEKILETKKPVLLSTGMNKLEEIDDAVCRIKRFGVPFGVFQCTSSYPCPPEKIGLNLIPFFKDRYNCPVGLSDHSGFIFPGLSAATIGANFVEVHVTFSRKMFGPDVPSSITIEELKTLIDGIRFIEKMRSSPIDKNKLAEELKPMRNLFNKSLFFRKRLTAGTVLEEGHLVAKKPGTGIPSSRLPSVIGKRLKVDVQEDQFLREEDLEEV